MFDFIDAPSISSPEHDGFAEVYYRRKEKKRKEMKRNARIEANQVCG